MKFYDLFSLVKAHSWHKSMPASHKYDFVNFTWRMWQRVPPMNWFDWQSKTVAILNVAVIYSRLNPNTQNIYPMTHEFESNSVDNLISSRLWYYDFWAVSRDQFFFVPLQFHLVPRPMFRHDPSPLFMLIVQCLTYLDIYISSSRAAMPNGDSWCMGCSSSRQTCIKSRQTCKQCLMMLYHSAPEQWPSEKKTSTPKINPNESVLQLYIDI